MLAPPTPGSAPESLARPTHTKKPQTLLEIIKSLGLTGLKVLCGYFALLGLLAAIHFPYRVDDLGSPKAREEAESFYANIYSAPVAEQKAAPEVSPADEDSKYVKFAREAIENARIVPKITAFAEQYR